MTAYVLDARVAAKWFLPPVHETLASKALQVLREYGAGRIRLLVPDLFWPEFGNVLWKAVRQKRISLKSAEQSILELANAGIGTEPSKPLLQNAFTIAAAFDQTVYDGIYVALAIASDTPLITADERLANALGAQFPVRWLGWL